jgi:sigma-B regulation protein RsbU (phosphoserine phosphatase)
MATRVRSPRPRSRLREFLAVYTRDLTSEDLHHLFVRDTVDAYRFFARGVDLDAVAALPWPKRAVARVRLMFVAVMLKLSPARRLVFGIALLAAVIGLMELFRAIAVARVPLPLGIATIDLPLPMPRFAPGTFLLALGFLLANLLFLLEVFDRLSLKNDLEIAKQIQQAMLPETPYGAAGLEAYGRTRPANTVGGDFYDVLTRDDGSVLFALGDVAGKGSPAALLMALLLAIFRTLVEEELSLSQLAARLNEQVTRHAPASRFITLFVGCYDPATGSLTYVNAGQNPPLLRRAAGGPLERLTGGGVALGMFEGSHYDEIRTVVAAGDVLVLYSDGVTEAEDRKGRPFEESGLERVIAAHADAAPQALADAVFRAVEAHAHDTRLADDLTILVVRRDPAAGQAVPAPGRA